MMDKTQPLEIAFNAAVHTMFSTLISAANLDYYVAVDGNYSWEDVGASIARHKRIPVYEADQSNYGIIADEEIFYELAAWIALTSSQLRTTDANKVLAAMSNQLIDRYSYDKTVARWLAYLHAYVVGITSFVSRRRRYPMDAYELIVQIVDKGLDYALDNFEVDSIAA